MSLADPGGSVIWNTNQRIDSAKMNDASTLAEKNLWDGFADLVFDSGGFVGDGCQPIKGAGDLDWIVGTGFGVVSKGNPDPFLTDFQPMYVSSAQGGTLDAHDGQPRIDIISITSADVDEQPESLKILSGGSLVTQVLDTKRRRTFALTVTKGTPSGSPVQPGTPLGDELVAVINVPATSGPITVTDARRRAGFKSSALGYRPWRVVVTAFGALVGNARTLTCQIQDLEGNVLTSFPEGSESSNEERFRFMAEVFTDEGEADATLYTIGVGANVSGEFINNRARQVLTVTNSAGSFTLVVNDVVPSGLDTWLRFTPIAYHDNNNTTIRGPVGYPTVARVDF